ncbi:MAG TPA: polymerase [Cyanothece sp. UBA12306]|nr:polymerase [Cyanothece sp. UBA12306]
MKTNNNSSPSTGRLFIILIACFYILFTLLPDSHSLMVKWSWVFVWQVGLLCPIFCFLATIIQTKQIKKLGLGLDWVVGLIIFGVFISSLFAEFPNQARWYGLVTISFICALYTLNSWIELPKQTEKLLTFQGYVNLSFIGLSLLLWTTQTLLPELSRLDKFKQFGVNLSFDFSTLELRNWAPIGHQNYVAGYLLLALPLLVALAINQQGKKRWLWITGIVLGLLDIYTTSSRGGWLGLLVLFLFSIIILSIQAKVSRFFLFLGSLSGLFLIIILAIANNRLRTLILAIFQGNASGELLYRLINLVIGWEMGISHRLTGIGLGGVPLLYQKYRPIWAGRESELAYQLHSTPVQLWAEMGVWGIISLVSAIILLTYHSWRYLLNFESLDNPQDSIFLVSLYGGLLAYGVMSITDYQLDNICISGTLVIYLACLTSILRLNQPENRSLPLSFSFSWLGYTGLGLVLVAIIWLIPIHRAWQLSSFGFTSLRQEKLEPFVKSLERSHQFAPWEPYYPYQLGWNLGNAALNVSDPQITQRSKLVQQGINWLEKGVKVSPYREFGYTNLAWLLLQNNNPVAAMEAFSQSVQLVPAKRGIMYGLGLSLLDQNKQGLAIEAFSLEGLRDPLFITSPLWRSPDLKFIYPQVLDQIISYYNQLLKTSSDADNFQTILHRSRGGIYWWLGDLNKAQKDLEIYGTPLSKNLLAMTQGKSFSDNLEQPASLVIQAWNNPSQRSILLQQAWIKATKTLLPKTLEKQLLDTMNQSSSFDQWLKENAPSVTYRRQRSGFGVLSRHIDGSIPQDFLVVVDNLPLNTWFNQMLPSLLQNTQLELALEPLRDELLEKIQNLR